MNRKFRLSLACLALLLGSASMTSVFADELTQRIQADLVTLGYEPGSIDGEATPGTTLAIAKYQTEHDMPVTGEVSPLLASMIAADVSNNGVGAATAPVRDSEALRAAQQACLEQKVADAQQAKKKKRGFGRLLGAVARTASRVGNSDAARAARDVYNANASANDLSAAAKDLGLTEDAVAECQNP